MTDWDAVRLVAGREVGTRLRSKAFVVGTAATLLVLVAFSLVMKFIGGGSDATVGLSGSTAALAEPLKATAAGIGQEVETRATDEAAGRAQVADESLDALLVPDGDGFAVVVKKDIDDSLRHALNALATRSTLDRRITELGGDPAAVTRDVAVAVRPMEPPREFDGQQLVLGMVAGVLIYMALILTGQMVAQGVVEEKSSRVVELLLATIRPWHLMAGKVLGIGVVGLVQMVLIGGVGVAVALAADVLTIPVSAAVGTVVWLVVWFLLGFLAYALVFAALAALVSRQEDVAGVVTPPMMFVILGYVIGVSVLPADPDNAFVETMSVIPFFAPTLMPMRLAMGGVPVWQSALSVALVLALIPALVWLSGRIYRNAVMRSGGRVKLTDALRRV